MPDNTYTWVVMRDTSPLPYRVFQKKYALRSWLNGQSEPDTYGLTIYRFPPYGQVEGTEVFVTDIVG